MKKIIIGISLILVTFCLCGCTTTNDGVENPSNQNQYIENENQNNLEENFNEDVHSGNNSEGEVNSGNNDMSGENVEVIPTEDIVINGDIISTNWEDGEFLYNGKKVKLICNFSELEKNIGLKLNDTTKYDYVLNPNYTVSAGQCNVGNSENIVINLLNSSDEVKNYSQCDVDTFSINIFYLKKDGDTNYSKIQLAKNITWDSTADEIIAAYGEPYKRVDNEYGFNLYYRSNDNYSKLEFGFNNELGMTSIYYTID